MSMPNTLRPGVFSQYTISSLAAAGRSLKNAALLLPCRLQEPVWLTSFLQASALLGSLEEPALVCARLLFEAGVNTIYLLPLPEEATEQQLEQALALLENQEVYAIVAQLPPQALSMLCQWVEAASALQRERLAFVGLEQPDQALAAAAALNSERMLLTCPAVLPTRMPGATPQSIYAACALAGAVLALPHPAQSLSGVALTGLQSLPQPLRESEIEQLLAGGVTPLEELGGRVECVRAITTRTATGGLPDRSFAPVGTTLIIDDMLAAVRSLLKSRLQGLSSTPQALAAIASQVTVLLAAKQEDGVITAYESPVVARSGDDPSVCTVHIAFHVAYAVNQIHLQAHVLV